MPSHLHNCRLEKGFPDCVICLSAHFWKASVSPITALESIRPYTAAHGPSESGAKCQTSSKAVTSNKSCAFQNYGSCHQQHGKRGQFQFEAYAIDVSTAALGLLLCGPCTLQWNQDCADWCMLDSCSSSFGMDQHLPDTCMETPLLKLISFGTIIYGLLEHFVEAAPH